jgi:hypothetical protein
VIGVFGELVYPDVDLANIDVPKMAHVRRQALEPLLWNFPTLQESIQRSRPYPQMPQPGENPPIGLAALACLLGPFLIA